MNRSRQSAGETPDHRTAADVSIRQIAGFSANGLLMGPVVALLEWLANRLHGGTMPVSSLVVVATAYSAVWVGVGFLAGLSYRAVKATDPAWRIHLGIGVAIVTYGSMQVALQPGRSSFPFLYIVLCVALPFLIKTCRFAAAFHDRRSSVLQYMVVAVAAIILSEILLGAVMNTRAALARVLILLVAPLAAARAHNLALAFMERRWSDARWSPHVPMLIEIGAAWTLAAFFMPPSPFLPLTASGTPATADPSRPNVLLVSLDTVRADHMSLYGYDRRTTPFLESFAQECLTFTNCISTSPWTLPSHASIFTGLVPRTHGARLADDIEETAQQGAPLSVQVEWAPPLAEEFVTLAEILNENGYATAGIVANHSFLYRHFGLAQGFDYYDDSPQLFLRRKPLILPLLRRFDPTFLLRTFHGADHIVDEAIEWLDEGLEKPFFLFVNFMDVHEPIVVPRARARWTAPAPGSWRRPRLPENSPDVRVRSALEQQTYADYYDDALTFVDAQTGRLIDALERRELLDDTLVVVVGDHGELLGEHLQIGHIGRTPFEGLARVPLLIRFPAAEETGIHRARVQLHDLFPTILNQCVGELPSGLQGDVLPHVGHPIVIEQFIHTQLARTRPQQYDRELRAVYDGQFKLIADSRGHVELYDLSEDPTESNDLSADRSDVVQSLRSLLSEWQEEHPVTDILAGNQADIPVDVMERLRSLGYVE